MDPPARVLALAVAALPDDRRDWGVAMAAELTEVRDRPTRWWFAAGCARAALFPPRHNGIALTWVGVGAATAMIVAGRAIGDAGPAMRVFAVAFVAFACVVFVMASSRRVRPPVSLTAAGVTGVVACLAATGYVVIQYPTAALHLRPNTAIFLAAILAVFLWLTLIPPRQLAGNRLARWIALGTAGLLAAGLVLASRLGLRGVGGFDDGIFGYLFYVPIVVLAIVSTVAALAGRGADRGVDRCACLACVLRRRAAGGGALVPVNSSLIIMGDGVPIDAVGENLRNLAWGLILFPFWWLPFGVIGAAIGASVWRFTLARRRSL